MAIGSNPPGSLFYSLASGLAKVISEASPMQAQVQPYAGTSTFVPLFDSGELELGVVNAVDMGMVYQGQKLKVGGRNPFPHVPSSRLLMRGSPLRSSLIVRKDSPIKTIGDVKGKRVTGEYPAQLAVWYNVFGSLSNGGLDMERRQSRAGAGGQRRRRRAHSGTRRCYHPRHRLGESERSRCRRRYSLHSARLLQTGRSANQESRAGILSVRSSKPAHQPASSKTPALIPTTFISSAIKLCPTPSFETFSRRFG